MLRADDHSMMPDSGRQRWEPSAIRTECQRIVRRAWRRRGIRVNRKRNLDKESAGQNGKGTTITMHGISLYVTALNKAACGARPATT
ncbi:hypothetical protein AA101099_1988 [Neoasaia chiangmaiensis NBRC 101099]|nr:hypothetical protein AA101099_1988 [Neoasaia chiangmaiensis NBRC 101099]